MSKKSLVFSVLLISSIIFWSTIWYIEDRQSKHFDFPVFVPDLTETHFYNIEDGKMIEIKDVKKIGDWKYELGPILMGRPTEVCVYEGISQNATCLPIDPDEEE